MPGRRFSRIRTAGTFHVKQRGDAGRLVSMREPLQAQIAK
jgi:hypothetical protein